MESYRFSKAIIFLVAICIASVMMFCGCNTSDGSEDVVKKQIKVLTFEEVDSVLYNELQTTTSNCVLDISQYQESTDLSQYDLLVIDCDNLNYGEITDDSSVIKEAFNNNLNILLVDIKNDQMTDIEELTGLIIEDDCDGILINREINDNGFVHIKSMIFPENQEGEEETCAADAQMIMDYLMNNFSLDFTVNDDEYLLNKESYYPIDNPPVFAIYKSYSIYQKVHTYLDTPKGKKDEMLGVTFRTDAYYDTISNTYKVFFSQNGIVYLDSNNNYYQGTDRIFQSDFYTKVSVDDSSAHVVDFTPKNVNHQTSYTESMNCTIGGSASKEPDFKQQATASFQVGFSKTRTITDWSIENNSSGDSYSQWRYYQTNRRRQFYEDLPNWSRLNFNLYNTTLWELDSSRKTVTFNCSGKRVFGKALRRNFWIGLMGDIEVIAEKEFSFKPISVTLPSH